MDADMDRSIIAARHTNEYAEAFSLLIQMEQLRHQLAMLEACPVLNTVPGQLAKVDRIGCKRSHKESHLTVGDMLSKFTA